MNFNLYAENAETCFHMAQKAKSEGEGSAWLQLAVWWVQLARRWAVERAQRSGIEHTSVAMGTATPTKSAHP